MNDNTAKELVPASLVSMLSPFVTKELFSTKTGLRPDQVRGQSQRKNLPMIKIGKFNLVNVAMLAYKDAYFQGLILIETPAQTAEQFAQACGLSERFIESRLDKDIPRTKVGRLGLVNVAELYRRCLNAE